MRKKLIKLIHYCTSCEECRDEDIADHIIASGFIEELQNESYDLGVDSALHNHFGLSWEDAAGLRKEVTRLQNATKWIPVTERLPDIKKMIDGEVYYRNVAVRVKNLLHERIAYYDPETECWYDTGFFQIRGVTHWAELPEWEPPKGE